MSSLGDALGLGHQLYVGFDKHAVRLLTAFAGVPLFLTLAAAIVVLSHRDVGWSPARVEVWWAVHARSDAEYMRLAPVVVRLLKLLCLLPPLLALLLALASGIVLGVGWGLAAVAVEIAVGFDFQIGANPGQIVVQCFVAAQVVLV